jgi:hypothetical protein
MSTCDRLFHASVVSAYFVSGEHRVVIIAEVTANPAADQVHICPNPIAIPPSREFLVAGTTSPGIHPDLVMKRRVSTSFSTDLTPKSVIVYSAGIDSPVRQEVAVATVASQAQLPMVDPVPPVPNPNPVPPHKPVEVTGFSPTFSLEEAVQDALAQAAAKLPAPPRNPDVAVGIDIQDISARSGGNIRPGLIVRAIAR